MPFSVVALPGQSAGATPLRVTNCNDVGPGSLRAAVEGASSGATITFATSCPTITLAAGFIVIMTNLSIKGPGAANLAVSGDNNSSVFWIQSGVTASISGLTIEDGLGSFSVPHGPDSNGGGIYNEGNLTVKDSSLSNNTAGGYGGAIYNLAGLTVKDSSISSNTAGNAGGGIYNFCCNASVLNSTLSNNSVAFSGGGGGIYNSGLDGPVANLSVVGSTLTANSASNGSGGGILNTGTADCKNCSLANNTALYGGGFESDLSMTVTNTGLSGNSATTEGGGAYDHGALTVRRGTFTNNSATNGGAVYIDNKGVTTIKNSVFSHNPDSGNDVHPGIDNAGGSLTVRRSTFS
jgi:predicted outer membrane repeat protein